MRERGHPEATRLRSTLHVPDGRGGAHKADGVVVADSCATILVVKNALNEATGTRLQRLLFINGCACTPML